MFKQIAALAIASLIMTGTALANDRRVIVHNQSDDVVVQLFGSNVGTDDWEEDVLGRGVIYPWDDVLVDFDDGSGYCKFDIRAVFDDGTEVLYWDFNVCVESDLYLR